MISQNPQHKVLFDAIRAKHDLAYFAKLVLGSDISPLNVQILRALGPSISGENHRTISNAPRGAGLTTDVLLLILHELIFSENTKVNVIVPPHTRRQDIEKSIHTLAEHAVLALDGSSLSVDGVLREFSERVVVRTNPETLRGLRPDLIIVTDASRHSNIENVMKTVGCLHGRTHFTLSGDQTLMSHPFFNSYTKIKPDNTSNLVVDMLDGVFRNFSKD